MNAPESFEDKVRQAIANPSNLGAMDDADAVGTVGGAGCGDMLRMWLKFREENGRKVIDKASFQSFGCETAIAAASLATELIKGKSTQEALTMSGAEMAADLGPLPPTKIHCTTMVEDALRSAIESHEKALENGPTECGPTAQSEPPKSQASPAGSLLDQMHASSGDQLGLKVVFLPPEED